MAEETNTSLINKNWPEELKSAFRDFLREMDKAEKEYRDEIYGILKEIDERKIKQIKDKLGI